MGLVGKLSHDSGWSRISLRKVCSASTFWVPALSVSGLCERHAIYAYDFDGHGLSDFSGRDDLTINDLVEDLKDVLETLKLTRVILMAHSMNGVRLSFVGVLMLADMAMAKLMSSR